jgi:hypothetical protein
LTPHLAKYVFFAEPVFSAAFANALYVTARPFHILFVRISKYNLQMGVVRLNELTLKA